MSVDDLPPAGRFLRGVTVAVGSAALDWLVWHPIERRKRPVAAILFADGEVLDLSRDIPRSIKSPNAAGPVFPPRA